MSDDPSSLSNKKNLFERIADAFTSEAKDTEELKDFLEDAHENGVIDEAAHSIMKGALEVTGQHVRDIMVPRSQMTCISAGSSLESIMPVVIETAHSRFPVLDGEGQVTGVLLAKDLLVLGMECRFDLDLMQSRLPQIIREPVFVPESKRLNTLLRDFRVNRNHLAIVIDEYGEIAGLVTIEDVLEEIVGEIEDEHDDESKEPIIAIETGVYQIDPLLDISDFNDYFSWQFPDTEFDTLGGIVTHAFGHLPKRGESIVIGDVEFKVLASDGRRIKVLEARGLSPRSRS